MTSNILHIIYPFFAIFFQVPDDANKSLWLPKTDNGSMYSTAVKKLQETSGSDTTYATCEMYKNPQNHSLGTQPCVDGYEFHMDNNEWNIISEVKIACVALCVIFTILVSFLRDNALFASKAKIYIVWKKFRTEWS